MIAVARPWHSMVYSSTVGDADRVVDVCGGDGRCICQGGVTKCKKTQGRNPASIQKRGEGAVVEQVQGKDGISSRNSAL